MKEDYERIDTLINNKLRDSQNMQINDALIALYPNGYKPTVSASLDISKMSKDFKSTTQ